MGATFETIPAGTPGVQIKVARLRALVDTARRDPALRRLAELLTRRNRERDAVGDARSVSEWIRGHVRYVRDPVGVEWFTDPRILARRGLEGTAAGDCDDTSALGAALLESLGHPTRFVVGGDDGAWRHVWIEVLGKRGWLPVDDTNKSRPTGWNPRLHFGTTMDERRAQLARLQRPRVSHYADGMVREHPVLFGGAAALHGLGGFSLKKAVKRIGKVVGKVVKVAAAPVLLPIAASPVLSRTGIGKAASRALPGTLRKVAGAVGSVSGAGIRAAAPIVSTIAAPGSGGIVSEIVDRLVPDSSMRTPGILPGLPGVSLPPIMDRTMPTGGGGGGPLYVTEDPGQASSNLNRVLYSPWTWTALAAFVLLRNRRR